LSSFLVYFVFLFQGNFQGFSNSELTKQKLDWKQLYDFSSEDEGMILDSAVGIHGKNRWPCGDILPNFKPVLTTYFKVKVSSIF
jgi:hypothetical protein